MMLEIEIIKAIEQLKESIAREEVDCVCGEKADVVGLFQPTQEFCKQHNVPIGRKTVYGCCTICLGNTSLIESEIAKHWERKKNYGT